MMGTACSSWVRAVWPAGGGGGGGGGGRRQDWMPETAEK